MGQGVGRIGAGPCRGRAGSRVWPKAGVQYVLIGRGVKVSSNRAVAAHL